jgi:O-antigen ligase
MTAQSVDSLPVAQRRHAAFHQHITNLVAFLLPALALCLPSGYAYGASLLVLFAVAASPAWLRCPAMPSGTGWLVFAIVAMGCVWVLGSDPAKGWSNMNKPGRYLMALPCLFYLLAYPPRVCALFAGVAVGAAGAGLRALYDVQVMGIERAWGYLDSPHNSIQYGNLSGLLGLMCWVLLFVQWGHWRSRTLLALGACGGLGLLGSLLSQTRGGWLALALCMVPLAWLVARRLSWRLALGGGALLLAVVTSLVWYKAPELERRLAEARSEVSSYQTRGDAHSSVGQRLDHWQLAWHMGMDRPLMGWGEAGYQTEKLRRVEAGQAHPFVLQFGHAHNELLDQFVKRGLLGVAGLLLFYAIPLVLFWPSRSRVTGDAGRVNRGVLCLRLLGVLLPLAYIGFGLTQVFLAHYSGNMFYLFMSILVFGALQFNEVEPAGLVSESPAVPAQSP